MKSFKLLIFSNKILIFFNKFLLKTKKGLEEKICFKYDIVTYNYSAKEFSHESYSRKFRQRIFK